jgi:hypothetical protein
MQASVDLSAAQKVLLACGILASLLKVGTDILAGMMWKGYDFISQSMSQLSALGAQTRPLVLPLDLTYDLLMIAFGVGLWQLAGQNLLMRIMAGLIIGNVVITFVVSSFFPMRTGQNLSPSANTINVVLMATSVIFFLLAMGLGAAAYRNWFRYYSAGTLLTYIVLGIMRFLVPPQATAGLPVSTVGAQERTMTIGYLLWVVLLAILQAAKVAA